VPLVYRSVTLDACYFLDMMVDGRVIVELKSVDALAPIHEVQMLTYLRLTKCSRSADQLQRSGAEGRNSASHQHVVLKAPRTVYQAARALRAARTAWRHRGFKHATFFSVRLRSPPCLRVEPVVFVTSVSSISVASVRHLRLLSSVERRTLVGETKEAWRVAVR
jgi:hypothetical protein